MSDVIDLIAQVEEALPANSTIRSDPLLPSCGPTARSTTSTW
jgi:hypothetical protein